MGIILGNPVVPANSTVAVLVYPPGYSNTTLYQQSTTVVNVVQAVQVANAFTGNFGGNVSQGNSVVLAMTGFTTGTVIASSNPTFNGGAVAGAAKLAETQTALGSAYTSIWLLPNVQSSGTSFGITTNASSSPTSGIFAFEVAGIGPSADKSHTAFGGGTTDQNSGASGAITAAPEFIISSVYQNGTAASSGYPPANWASSGLPGNANLNSVTGYQIATVTGGSYTYDIGTVATGGTASWAAVVATVKPFAAVPPQVYVGTSVKVSAANGMNAPISPLNQETFSASAGATLYATTGSTAASAFQFIMSTTQ